MAVDESAILVAPLEVDRPHSLRRLISGGMLLLLALLLGVVASIEVTMRPSQGWRVTMNLRDWICPLVLIAIALAPFIMGLIGVIARKHAVHPKIELPDRLQPLYAIRWPLRRLTRHAAATDEVRVLASSGVRAVIGPELVEWARATEVPCGLLEPAPLYAARPVGGCRTTADLTLLVLASLLLGPFIVFGILSGAGNTGGVIGLCLLLVTLFFLIIRSVVRLPSMQRHLVDVPIIGTWVRDGLRTLGAVAGPGWVRSGERIWHAQRDLLLIRRRGSHSVEGSLEIMLIGEQGRLRFLVAGTGDPMTRRLWAAWMSPDVRPDLAMTELAAAVN